MNQSKPIVTILGDLTTDVYVDAKTVKFGGAALNMAMWTKRLGGKPFIVSAVGNDVYGKEMYTFLKRAQLSTTGIQLKKGATSTIDIFIKNGERHYGVWNPGVLTDFHLGKKEKLLLNKSHAILVTVYPHYKHILDDLVFWKSKRTENHSPLVINFGDLKEFDGNLDIVKQYNDLADILIFGLNPKENASLISTIGGLKRENQLCIVTLGKDGSVAWKGDQKYSADALETNVVDTTGAGDAYLAGFITEYLQSGDVQTALTKGAEVAARVIGKIGAY